jgi:hypothetical protein
MTRKPMPLSILAILCLSALTSLISLFGTPSFADIRTVDLVHIIATGMTFGATLVAVGLYFVSRYHRTD